MSRLVLPILVTAISLLAFPMPVSAGTYDVRACIYEAPLHFDAWYEQYGAGRVDVVHNCNTQARGWTGIYQTRKGTPFANGEGAGFRWYAPAGASFVASRALGKLRNANGIAAQFYATNPDGGFYSLDANTPHDGSERIMHVDFSGWPRSQVAARLACLTNPPCSNRASDVKAFFELSHITLTLRDSIPPAIAAGGDLFDRPPGQEIYRGAVSFAYTAVDSGGGIHRPYAEVNSTFVDLGPYHCVGAHAGFADRTHPCPPHETRHTHLDTSRPPFGEGANRIRICVQDYATAGSANVACTPVRHLTVDNTAPAAPIGLTVEGGEGWRAESGFNIRWTNPPGQTTPLVAAHYRLEDPTSGAILQGERQVQANGISSLQGIHVPRRGHYRLRVWLRDAAGNTGPGATVQLRLDDLAPGHSGPLVQPKWLSARDFPYRLELAPAAAGGPSGVLGYAARLNADEPAPPCPTGHCRPEDLALGGGSEGRELEIGHLDEGLHWLSTAAVSGAWLRSEETRSIPLRVDRTDPRTQLTGAPQGWVREPVTVQAQASDALSGMKPDPDQPGEPPVTTIATDGQRPRQEVGSRAALVLDREGVHSLRYWARDLAGNANDGRRLPNGHLHDPPGETIVKIDWTAPAVAFLEEDRDHPELIRARADDALSGPAGGEISYRPAGTIQPFSQLATSLVDGRLEAQLPSDDLPDGAYEFQATAWDKAGNVGHSALRQSGDAMVLQLPLKDPVAIIAGFAKGSGARKLLKHGARAVVEGQVSDTDGTPLAGTPVELVERFDPGSRIVERVTPILSDAEGRYRHRLAVGPSRGVSARFPGNQTLARTESAPLRLVFRSRINFAVVPQVVRNRDFVRMRGRVQAQGAILPSEGKLIAIQYLDPARRRWRPAEILRTDRRGRFRHRYRFRTVSSPQRFVFRAVAPAEAGWPYRPVSSGSRAVVVYPR